MYDNLYYVIKNKYTKRKGKIKMTNLTNFLLK